ncbi:hypothetical protein GPJ59_29740 [Streptomyces bambusae]|uniref:LigA protein n=1 Tax=Streptomyces bambusae TaxID=1550616 RepID=A0ABS6ZDZ5_9ACTN|nr:hypothetical protein [Streptomyces bambusae]
MRATAIAATFPYLALKSAWVAGSHIGIPEGSVLRGSSLFWPVVNTMTLLMDAALVVLVLALTRPWGRRIPSWLLLVPGFVASGLLTPIVTGFPAQLLMRAFGVGGDTAGQAPREPFLDGWVFNVVYAGFSVQAFALAGLFVPYAKERWGHLWRRPTGLSAGLRTVAVAAAAGALAFAGAEAYWTLGGTAGLTDALVAARDADAVMVGIVQALCTLMGAAGALLLAFGRGAAGRIPLAAAWVGGAAAASWGLWVSLAALAPGGDPAKKITWALHLAYAGQMITGLLVAVVLTGFLTGFLAARRPA